MTIPDEIDLDHEVIAVVGVAKNCGKTTTLNALASHLRQRGHVIGFVSAGIDGETSDVLLGTPKPPVALDAGDLVATTRDALARSDVEVEYLDDLGFSTPLGEAVVVRARTKGTVLLAGMRHRDDLAIAVDALQSHGVDRTLIDGAYGRVMSARPGLADAVIVATGAVVSPRADVVARRTATLVRRLTLPEADEPWQRVLLDRAIELDRALLGGPEIEPIELPAKSALVGLSKGRDRWTPKVQGVAVPGLVSDRVIQELVRRRRTSGVLLIPDGTVLQADARAMRKFDRAWTIRVRNRSDVIGIAFNPTGIRGQRIRDDHLAQALGRHCPKIPVFNPLLGIQ